MSRVGSEPSHIADEKLPEHRDDDVSGHILQPKAEAQNVPQDRRDPQSEVEPHAPPW